MTKEFMSGYIGDGKEYTLIWNDGSTENHSNVPDSLSCRNCNGKIYDLEKRAHSDDLCQECFPVLNFGVPFKLDDCEWNARVQQTSKINEPTNFTFGGADFRGNNFGVGDIILYDPKRNPNRVKVHAHKIEGVVLEIHQYFNYYSHKKRFLTKTHLDRHRKFIWADSLEALTCEHLELDTSKFDGLLDSIVCNFDPNQSESGEVKSVFENPTARAIWMSYRHNHLVDNVGRLNNASLKIAQELLSKNLSRDRVHLWFKLRMRDLGFKIDSDEQIAALIPYLMHEKQAQYRIAV